MSNNSNDRDWAKQKIQGAGLRATSSRIATLLVLRQAESPLTHAEVSGELEGHQFDKATIFRNLNDMVTAELLRKTALGDHAWRFEMASEEDHQHPHFVCVDCGHISCMHDVELTSKSKNARATLGQVTEILLRGHCGDCA